MFQLRLLSQIRPEISRYGRIKQHCFGDGAKNPLSSLEYIFSLLVRGMPGGRNNHCILSQMETVYLINNRDESCTPSKLD